MPENIESTDMQIYHKNSKALKSTDLLEIHQVLAMEIRLLYILMRTPPQYDQITRYGGSSFIIKSRKLGFDLVQLQDIYDYYLI